jgi:hypothetical protein
VFVAFESAAHDPNEQLLGEEECMRKFASANALNGGFYCFGCSMIYELPSPGVGPDAYYADEFDFL